MHLSRFTDYALRVLIYLGGQPGASATVDDVAVRYGISKEHLRKVVHRLALDGWIDSRRGRGGGLMLARDPSEIAIGAVVRSTESSFAIVECFEPGRDRCRISGVCRLTGMLDEALQAFLGVLDGYTLADIVADETGLLARLGVPQPGPNAAARQ